MSYKIHTANITLDGKKLRPLSRISEKGQVFPLSPLFFNIVVKVLARAIKQNQDIKPIQIGKEVKWPLFADNMTLYVKVLKSQPKRLLEIVNEFCNSVRYKINVQKSIVFLINKISEK